MSKRKYTHIKELEPQIIAMRESGMTRQDGLPPKQDIEKELERLRMENKLLRDFLHSTERK